jgi:hypothetical protein
MNGLGELVDLGQFPFDKNFDAAVREVSHVPDQVETASQPAACRSKPYPLNPAGICDAPTFQGHEFAKLPVPGLALCARSLADQCDR